MRTLPDLEGWAIFACLVETGSFAKTATVLGLTQPTVSKAIARLEQRIGTMLIYRTSRKLSLTTAGNLLLDRATRLLADSEILEAEAVAQAHEPRGLLRLNAPISFGIRYLAPILPTFLEHFPEINVDLVLTDQIIDIVENSCDVTIRIANMKDSTLRARRVCTVNRSVVASPTYLEQHGRPEHPRDLNQHKSIRYASDSPSDYLYFRNKNSNEEYAALTINRIRSNNADALIPSLLSGHGIALFPDFLIWDSLRLGELERVICDWQVPSVDVHLVTAPGMLRAARVTALLDFLVRHLSSEPWALPDSE
ncbi:MAG: LysR family transcriptional regulator [Burkholderia sp.]